MNIVIEKEINGRFKDGIDAILNLSDDEFNRFKKLLIVNHDYLSNDNINFYYPKDKCNNPNENIKYGLFEDNKREYRARGFRIKDIVSELEIIIKDFSKDSKKYNRILEIINIRNINGYKRYFYNGNKEIVDRFFDVLMNDSTCEKFIDFDNNKEYFLYINIEEYLKLFGKIFEYRDSYDGEENSYFAGFRFLNKFNISNDIIKKININSLKIYNKYIKKYMRFMDKRYEFRCIDNRNDYKIIRKEDEPNFNVDDKLRDAILSNMPNDLSLEEKAIYIYIKLCKIFKYNDEYFYREKGISLTFDNKFLKEHLESISIDSKITCYDFARIYSKLINELNGDIESVIISQGLNQGHFLTAFYTDKVSVRLEPLIINSIEDYTNDLMKAKNGIKLKGLEVISDKDNILNGILNKMCNLIYGKEALNIDDFLNELKNIPSQKVEDNLNLKLESFLQIMNERKISESELVQTFIGFLKLGFFGENVEKAFIGKREKINNENHIKRMILLRKKCQDNVELYLLDTSLLKVINTTYMDMNNRFNSNEFIYEDGSRIIDGIGKEEQDEFNR